MYPRRTATSSARCLRVAGECSYHSRDATDEVVCSAAHSNRRDSHCVNVYQLCVFWTDRWSGAVGREIVKNLDYGFIVRVLIVGLNDIAKGHDCRISVAANLLTVIMASSLSPPDPRDRLISSVARLALGVRRADPAGCSSDGKSAVREIRPSHPCRASTVNARDGIKPVTASAEALRAEWRSVSFGSLQVCRDPRGRPRCAYSSSEPVKDGSAAPPHRNLGLHDLEIVLVPEHRITGFYRDQTDRD